MLGTQIPIGGYGSYDPIAALDAKAYWIAGTGQSTGAYGSASPPDITDWLDQSSFGNTLIQHVDKFPDHLATGWNGASPAMDFASGAYFELAPGYPLTTATAGARTPFSVLARVKFDGAGQQTLCSWLVASGSDRIVFGISAGGKLQLVRQAAAGPADQLSTGLDVGTSRTTVGCSFASDGSAQLFIDGIVRATASASFFSGSTINTNLFKVGTGPLLPADGMDGQIKALLVNGRSTVASEHLSFHNHFVGLYG